MSYQRNRIVTAVATGIGMAAYILVPDRETLATWLLAVIAMLGWVFVLAYGLRSHWRATAAGRGVMLLMLCLTLICSQGIATILTDYSYPGREYIRTGLLLGIALAVLHLVLTLLSIQRHGVSLVKKERA